MNAIRQFPRLGLCSGTLVLSFFSPAPASAAEVALGVAGTGVEMHGFLSQGLILSFENEYLARGSEQTSFEFSEVGINFTATPAEALHIGVQLFAHDLGASGNYRPTFDWYYLDYRFRDWLGLRVGRLKIPYGLYNEIHDIDAARVPVVLPGSVYPLQTRDILFAHSGAELRGFVRTNGLGAVEYRLFGGTIFFDPEVLASPGANVDLELTVPYVVGGRLLWETPLDGLRVAGSLQALRLETTAFIPGVPAISIENDSVLSVASAEYAVGELLLTAEYSRWYTEQQSDMPMLSPPIDIVQERAYAMASFRVTPWLQPAAYYSLFFPDTAERDDPENVQHDVALTLRFDITPHWLVKLEGHYMHGTAGLLNPVRVNPPDISTASEDWGVLFLKTTAYF